MQQKAKKKAAQQRRQYSKSHRTAKQSKLMQKGKKNRSKGKNANIRGSVLLDKLMAANASKQTENQNQNQLPFQHIPSSQKIKKKKTKKKKEKYDPFAIAIPTNFQSPITPQRTAPPPNSNNPNPPKDQLSQSTKFCFFFCLFYTLILMHT